MATSQRDLSDTVLGGSDELFDFYCQPCSTESLNVEAAGFCQQCQEYLCESCCRHHRKSTALKSHKILDKAEWPKTPIAPRVTDILTETCPKHAGKVLEYFCNGHGDICCSVCLNLDHSSCKNKSYIPDISTGIAKSQEYKTLVETLDKLVAVATNEQMQIELNYHDNDECRTRALANINQFKKEMDKILDHLVDEAVQNVTRLHQANVDEIKIAEQKCQSILSNAEAITTDLETKANASNNNQLMVDMKLTKRRLPTIEKDIQDVAGRKLSQFKFVGNEKVQDLRSTLSAMFTLSVSKGGLKISARYVQEVNVKTVEDKKDCNIRGIVVVAEDRLVVADENNVTVKLVDVRQNRVISRLALSSKPLDVIRTTPLAVAVVLREEHKVEILTVSDVLVRRRTISVQRDGFSSLCAIGDKFILLYDQARAVKTVDMSGKVLSTIYKDKDIDPLFKKPTYIALSRCQDFLYITDLAANTVITMTLKGQVVSLYKSDTLEYPLGVTVGRDGAVFVCSANTHTVHLLSATGQHMKILLDQQRKLATYPRAIAYDENGNRLCVSSGSNTPEKKNYIRLFQLDPPPKCKTITLERGPDGLGFSIVGGYGSPAGDLPIYVQNVILKGAASLKRGDTIMSVNNVSLEGLTHDEAVTIINNAKGSVVLNVLPY